MHRHYIRVNRPAKYYIFFKRFLYMKVSAEGENKKKTKNMNFSVPFYCGSEQDAATSFKKCAAALKFV